MSYHQIDDGRPRALTDRKKVMLATPTYGSPAFTYTFAIARAREALTAAGIPSAYVLLQGNPHVDDARNSLVRDFLESDCTELVFIDADVDFEPEALVMLCRRDVDVVGGVYPYRRDGGENMPVRLLDGAREPGDDGLLEVEGLPTGFLKIHRRVLEQLAALAPWYWDKLDRTALVFDRPDPDEHGTRWGGDIAFCNAWRRMGGKCYADVELRLGHTGTIIVRDSLGSALRRMSGTTLSHVIPRVRAGAETEDDYNEAFKYAGNPYVADPGVLAIVTSIARKTRAPMIETGSGLSSVFMAAACSDKVYSLEHVDHYAAQTKLWAEEAGVENLGICCAPLARDFWYDLEAFDHMLPRKFGVGFCDGPPRFYGTRLRYLDQLAPRCVLNVFDDIKTDANYLREVQAYADSKALKLQVLGRVALVGSESLLKAAA